MTAGFESYVDGWWRRFREAERQRKNRERKARALVPKLAEHLVARFGARRVILWGSLAAGRFGADSDIDLVVEGLPPGRALFRALAESADLAGEFRVDLVPWEDASAALRAAAEREGIVVHDARSA
ncbi:MAG: nucleotidyltransferase domain-containing protein [Myxococcota bacterium]|nr:nucleotidyltransferase domain-containing protein [Myxococcota bacterium]